MGFPWGAKIMIHQEHLVAGEKRKNVRSLRYKSPEEIDVKILQEVLCHVATLKH